MFVRRRRREGAVEDCHDWSVVQQLQQQPDFAEGPVFLLPFPVIMVPKGMR